MCVGRCLCFVLTMITMPVLFLCGDVVLGGATDNTVRQLCCGSADKGEFTTHQTHW